uniref:Uncharacterized protein n=1 Tax=Ditylenchus dipsaci TaxID=166011 RepID=A0A915DQM0_9BILA
MKSTRNADDIKYDIENEIRKFMTGFDGRIRVALKPILEQQTFAISEDMRVLVPYRPDEGVEYALIQCVLILQSVQATGFQLSQFLTPAVQAIDMFPTPLAYIGNQVMSGNGWFWISSHAPECSYASHYVLIYSCYFRGSNVNAPSSLNKQMTNSQTASHLLLLLDQKSADELKKYIHDILGEYYCKVGKESLRDDVQ